MSATWTWEDLATQQHDAAMVGGPTWRNFVLYAEGLTRMPWRLIRERIDPYVRAYYFQKGWV